MHSTIDDPHTLALEMTNVATVNQQKSKNRKITKITALRNPAFEPGRENHTDPFQPSPQGPFTDTSHIEVIENPAYLTNKQEHDPKFQPTPSHSEQAGYTEITGERHLLHSSSRGSPAKITTGENNEYEIVTDSLRIPADEDYDEVRTIVPPSVQEKASKKPPSELINSDNYYY